MQQDIKNKAVNGMAWSGIEKLATKAVQFVISLLIARVLMPEDYGIVGMLGIFMAIAQTFVDSGFANALIQKKDRTNVDYSTVFYFNLFLSVALYFLFYFGAPNIARFYNIPLLKSVTRVVALSLIINGLSIVQSTKLSIDLNFKAKAIITIVSVVVSGGVGLWMAYHGYGVWALVFQNITSCFIGTLILWLITRWRPLLKFSIESFKSLFSFGSKLLGSSLINTIYNNLYTLVIGKAFNAQSVGFYTRAGSFTSLPTDTILQMAVGVNYPILAQMQDDDERLLSAYKKLLRVPMYLLYPVLIGMAAVAEPMLETLIGSQWLPCAPYLRILCFGSMFIPLTHINLNLLYVKGRSDLVLKLELIKKPIAFLILIASIPFGVIWMCAGKALYDFIAFSFNCYYTKKLLGYSQRAQMKELLPIFINVAIMYLVVTLSMTFFDSAIVKLVVGVVTGAVTYVVYSIITRDESFIDVKNIVLERISRK